MSSWITRLQRLSRTTGVERAVRQIQTLTTQFLDLTSAPTELLPVDAPRDDWTTPASRVEETVAEEDEEPEDDAGEGEELLNKEPVSKINHIFPINTNSHSASDVDRRASPASIILPTFDAPPA